jgi:hypothetical protein
MNVRIVVATTVVLAIAGLGATRASAQEPPMMKPGPPVTAAGRTPPPVPVRVTVVLSRYQGDKRLSSMPYVLGVSASGWGRGQTTRLRMGTDVPVIQTAFGAPVDGKSVPHTSYTYRNVGTSIDCTASYDESTRDVFQLALTVSDTSVGLDTGQKQAIAAVAPNLPAFRSFNSEFTAVLKDGQTTQYTSATDPVTGEVTKIDVTLNLMK